MMKRCRYPQCDFEYETPDELDDHLVAVRDDPDHDDRPSFWPPTPPEFNDLEASVAKVVAAYAGDGR